MPFADFDKRHEGKKNGADEGTMTVQEAGRKGGETTKEKHGPEFYEEIGRKGGQENKSEEKNN